MVLSGSPNGDSCQSELLRPVEFRRFSVFDSPCAILAELRNCERSGPVGSKTVSVLRYFCSSEPFSGAQLRVPHAVFWRCVPALSWCVLAFGGSRSFGKFLVENQIRTAESGDLRLTAVQRGDLLILDINERQTGWFTKILECRHRQLWRVSTESLAMGPEW